MIHGNIAPPPQLHVQLNEQSKRLLKPIFLNLL